jgi:hypothetical protein
MMKEMVKPFKVEGVGSSSMGCGGGEEHLQCTEGTIIILNIRDSPLATRYHVMLCGIDTGLQ